MQETEDQFISSGVSISNADALDCYDGWETPDIIISDGAYGVNGFQTDTSSADSLTDWYEPHVEKWTEHAGAKTTLWVWNTELGWATIHPLLQDYGWEYRGANIWDKGIQHVSGNTNTETIRKFPQTTEMCVQYVRSIDSILGLSDYPGGTQQWLRDEWQRAGLTFQEANDVCDVESAATRKYFAADDKWYFPPLDKFHMLREYANQHGDTEGGPYLTPPEYEQIVDEGGTISDTQSEFDCPAGVTNVWSHSPIHSKDRTTQQGTTHPNEKPLKLINRILEVSGTESDTVWDPFSGSGSVPTVADLLDMDCYAAEIDSEYYRLAVERLKSDPRTSIGDNSQLSLESF